MNTLRRLLVDLVILLTIVLTAFFLYQNYGQAVTDYFFGTEKIGILINDVTITASIADTDEERKEGLSGVASLPSTDGKLFIFDRTGSYGFWMKDTIIPLDILWINEELEIVHIEENVRPETYPAVFNSPEPARFVLEVNAHFVSTFNIEVGDKVLIPSHKLPEDLR